MGVMRRNLNQFHLFLPIPHQKAVNKLEEGMARRSAMLAWTVVMVMVMVAVAATAAAESGLECWSQKWKKQTEAGGQRPCAKCVYKEERKKERKGHRLIKTVSKVPFGCCHDGADVEGCATYCKGKPNPDEPSGCCDESYCNAAPDALHLPSLSSLPLSLTLAAAFLLCCAL